MSDLPRLTRDMVRRWVEKRAFERGEEAQSERLVFDLRRQGRKLFGRCHDTPEDSHRVRVELNEGGIAGDRCSCTTGTRCKHVAALLLAWVDTPDEFEALAPAPQLEKLKKPDLVRIVQGMLDLEPDLYAFVASLTGDKGTATRTPTPDEFRKKADRIFRNISYEWGAARQAAEKLQELIKAGDKYLEQGDAGAAAAVYQGVYESIQENQEGIHDEPGDLDMAAIDCVKGLGECKKAGLQPQERRQEVLRFFFEVVEEDTEGTMLGEEAEEALQAAQGEDREVLIGWLRSWLEETPEDEGDFYRSLLLDLAGDQFDDEEYLQMCRQCGRIKDSVTRLLERGRVDEAEEEARTASDHRLLEIAEVFVQKKQGELAARLVRERAQKSQDSWLLNWLKKWAAQQGDEATRLELALTLFRQGPSFEAYQEVRDLAGKAGIWDGLRGQLLDRFREKGYDSQLVDVYLDEGDIDSALKVVGQDVRPSLRGVDLLPIRVADAVARERPRAALEIYRRHAEWYIKEQGRHNYKTAAEYLVKVRDLYDLLGERAEWRRYIAALREDNRRLRVLREELDAAKL